MSASGINSSNTPIVYGNYTDDSGYDAIAQLMKKSSKITAIIALNDMMAIGAIQWLNEHGIKIPEEISIVGYDDIPDAQRQVVPLTTIRIPSFEEGQKAANVIFDLIENRPINSPKLILPVHLIIRNSTTTQLY